MWMLVAVIGIFSQYFIFQPNITLVAECSHVSLAHIIAPNLQDLLSFVYDAVFLTCCSDLSLSDVEYEEQEKMTQRKTPMDRVFFKFLWYLRLTHFDASHLQWANFLSCLCIPPNVMQPDHFI